jgi:hypothetical protein
MSFHKAAIQVLLALPSTLEPAMMIALGYPAPPKATARRARISLPALDEIAYWERYG